MAQAVSAVAAPPAPVESPVRRKLEELFGIDRRTLALFRVGLGVLLLADLASRAQFLTALYTDAGMLPRAVLVQHSPEIWRPSLHLLAGGASAQVALFLVAAAGALALLVGYRTRVATVLCWGLAYSVQARNPFVHTGGDTVLLQLLFWSMFLPLGMHWSVDRALDTAERPRPQRVLSVATVGLLAHVGMLYVFSAHLKSGPEWRETFHALYYGLSIDSIATPLAVALLAYPRVLQVLTLATILLEGLGPVVAFSPVWSGPVRCLVVLGFWGLHAGIAVCFTIGLFPYVMIGAWLPWIPGWFWDRVFPPRASAARAGLRVYYDGECTFCLRLLRIIHTLLVLRDVPYAPAQSEPEVEAIMLRENSWVVIDHRDTTHLRFAAFIVLCRCSPLAWWVAPVLRLPPIAWAGDLGYRLVAAHRIGLGSATRWLALRPSAAPSRMRAGAANALAALALVYVFLFNLASVSETVHATVNRPWFPRVGHFLQMHQGWSMFAPAPRKEDGWLVMPAVLADGTSVDLFRDGAPVSFEKPARVSADFSSQRMWTYHMNLIDYSGVEGQPYLRAYAEYRMRQWNAAHEPARRAVAMVIVWMQESTPAPGEPQAPAEARPIYNYERRSG